MWDFTINLQNATALFHQVFAAAVAGGLLYHNIFVRLFSIDDAVGM